MRDEPLKQDNNEFMEEVRDSEPSSSSLTGETPRPMFALRRQNRNRGNSRGAMNNPTSSQPTSWDEALDDGSETDYDDGEAEYRQPLTPVEEDNMRLPDDIVSHFSPGQSRKNGRRTHNPNSTTPGVYTSQLLTWPPAGEKRNRGESDQRQRGEEGQRGEEAVRVFCPPEGETTRRSRSGGWSEERQEREAALKQIGANVEVVEVTQNYELKRGGRPCDQPLKVLQMLKWVAFNFKRELPEHRITKIEFIRNDRLYERFRKTKEEFKRLGKTTKEILLYHGTRSENVKRLLWPLGGAELTICLG
jgi:hypothetical protein